LCSLSSIYIYIYIYIFRKALASPEAGGLFDKLPAGAREGRESEGGEKGNK
jgi:hypothetical protein